RAAISTTRSSVPERPVVSVSKTTRRAEARGAPGSIIGPDYLLFPTILLDNRRNRRRIRPAIRPFQRYVPLIDRWGSFDHRPAARQDKLALRRGSPDWLPLCPPDPLPIP